jgi:ABC-type sugar transport system ATPase subunit
MASSRAARNSDMEDDMAQLRLADAPATAAATSVPDAQRPSALTLTDVSKAFGATAALVACSFELRHGEVHAIVGENGSGKSTLVKILSGVHRPDSGVIRVGTERYPAFPSPRVAQSRGIATVFQEVLAVGPRSVLENVWLGMEGVLRAPTGLAERRERVHDVLAELLIDPPDLDAPAEELSLSQRQACCIARALVRDPDVLILDESTSALDAGTCARVFDAVRRRVAEGMSAIFISHRMDEVKEVGERVTVMRSGTTVAAGLRREDASTAELVRLMTGADHLADAGTRSGIAAKPAGAPVLRTRGLRLREDAAPIDFAGLDGHGQDEFLWALTAGSVGGSVTVVEGTAETVLDSPWRSARHGVRFVPRERGAEALFGGMSVVENFSLATIDRDTRGGLIARSRSSRRLARFRERLGIAYTDDGQAIDTLSGGNQQKVVLARALAAEPRVLLLNDPTRGIDLGAKRDLYAALLDLVRDGVAVVMLSTEVDEHIELMDRVLVFREHRVFCELQRGQLDRTRLIAGFFGQGVEQHV